MKTNEKILYAIIGLLILLLLMKGCKTETQSVGGGGSSGGGSSGGGGSGGQETPVSDKMPCGSIRPAVAANCLQGRCDYGTCEFVPATTTIPARCQCSTCTDTDGGIDLNSYGVCTDQSQSIQDSCLGTAYVNENWCDNGRCMGASMVCPTLTKCENGRCVYNPIGDNFNQPYFPR